MAKGIHILIAVFFYFFLAFPIFSAENIVRHPVPREHPRLLGSLERLQQLAKVRPEAYARMVQVARKGSGEDTARLLSLALVSAIEKDEALGREAVRITMKYVNGPVRSGHVTFGYDLAYSALVYDLCYPYWSSDERLKYHKYMNETVDANINSETHVFHNAWYGYKHWGYGLACYATWYENPRAPEIFKTTQEDYIRRAVPALELAGEGGSWAEGYYINYWLYEWLFFCEAARFCEGIDYCEMAPKFFRNRAVASMFEAYPGIGEYGTRRPIPMGDGGGRVFGGDRDKVLSARRILVNRYRDDPVHQMIHAFNETTPRSGVGVYAYKDFLWRDITVVKGDLKNFKLSHLSPGPGYVYARSSWDDDATYFFFKCGNRFTAHQHLDVGHFLIYKYSELAGDGGHYDTFDSPHAVNYYVRTIAHNTMLILAPEETWSNIRGRAVTWNDGGQTHNWPNQNGAVPDVDAWKRGGEIYHIGDMLAYEDLGNYLYTAGDCTRAYSPNKLDYFTRQIVFIRPGTFVIFDRVKSKNPAFRKTWLLQAMKPPAGEAPNLVITNGQGRLFVQTLLPLHPQVKLVSGPDLYRHDGKYYLPERDTGPAPECRIEIFPSEPSSVDYFLHVLTATDASVASAPQAVVIAGGKEILVALGKTRLSFLKDTVGGFIEIGGKRKELVHKVN